MPDYIIVGGGSAGCVLAARLSEDADVSVTLLEAGPQDKNIYIHLPVGFFKMTSGPLIWGYETVAGREIAGRTMVYPQARVLGGGSSINAQVFTRGCPEDYDGWRDLEGCSGWGYEDVRPYFRKSEGNDTYGGPHHGTEGPLGVSSQTPHALTRVFARAAQEAGLPFNPDFNAGSQAGAGFYQTTTRKGRRSSTAVGYLRPAMTRRNLTVRTDAAVHRIVIENGCAVGVELIENGRPVLLRAEREVILTAGAIGSPKMLMLSGLGPANELRALDIDVVRDLPQVGKNLQDHMDVDVLAELSGPYGIDRYKKRRWQIAAGMEYALFGKGPVASNIVEGGGFWWGDRNEKTPETSYHVRPRSRGTVTLRSKDLRVAPLIDPNAFAEPYDLERAVDGIKISQEILSQAAFKPFVRRLHLPDGNIRTQAEYREFARQYARSAYHPVGTCRMGSADDAVVDPELKVRGIDGLRVCDSSVMPRLISSNTNAATVMIAEKAADILKGVTQVSTQHEYA